MRWAILVLILTAACSAQGSAIECETALNKSNAADPWLSCLDYISFDFRGMLIREESQACNSWHQLEFCEEDFWRDQLAQYSICITANNHSVCAKLNEGMFSSKQRKKMEKTCGKRHHCITCQDLTEKWVNSEREHVSLLLHRWEKYTGPEGVFWDFVATAQYFFYKLI